MKNFRKLHEGINPLPLLEAITPDLWSEDSYLRHYPQGPFGEIESIMLRFPHKVVFEGPDAEERLALYKTNMLPGFDQHESIDYPAYAALPQARPLVMCTMALVGGVRLGRCFINKINPGGRIFPHADTPVHADYYRRFHIVLQSAPGVDFRCADETAFMGTGELWWFDNRLEHEVNNHSDTARIHLVMDIKL